MEDKDLIGLVSRIDERTSQLLTRFDKFEVVFNDTIKSLQHELNYRYVTKEIHEASVKAAHDETQFESQKMQEKYEPIHSTFWKILLALVLAIVMATTAFVLSPAPHASQEKPNVNLGKTQSP